MDIYIYGDYERVSFSFLRVINIAEGATVQLSCAEEGFDEFPEEYYVSAR